MTTQLELNLGVLSANSYVGLSYDPSWDEPEIKDCPPTLKVGDRVQENSPYTSLHPFGSVISIDDEQALVMWEPYQAVTPINSSFLVLAHQQVTTCESVGGQVLSDTKKVAHQHDGWVEKYSVVRSDVKYFYWRFSWREGGKKQRHYIGSCTNPKAREKMEFVKSAIALGKSPREIIHSLR